MKNQGISLISLIITIIVIIILAAIVIFTGLGTPDSAQFSAFTNDVDTVYMAVMDKFADLKVQHAADGDYRTNEQLYTEVAIGKDNVGQYTRMATDDVNTGSATQSVNSTTTTNCIRIANTAYKSGYATELDITLPKVREDRSCWYIMSDGRVFNETGFVYNKKTYVNASYYWDGEQKTTHDAARATTIAEKMMANDFTLSD